MGKILSISVAAYNASKWLQRCLDSFLVSEIIDFLEILVINDGSSDNTEEIASNYVLKYPNTIRLINKENGGLGSTYNVAIQLAEGKYFKLVDADDWVEKDGLVDLVNILQRINVDVVLTPYYTVNANDGKKHYESCLSMQKEVENQMLTAEQLDLGTNILQMHAITFRTEILKGHFRLIDEKCFYVDVEYIVFYFNYVQRVYVTSMPVYDYLIGTEGQSVNIRNMIRQRNQHLQMCKSILNFISEQEHNLYAVARLVETNIMTHYLLLMKIEDSKQSRNEVMEFDAFIKNKNEKIYKSCIIDGIRKGKRMPCIVAMCRILHYCGYGVIHTIMKHI